ncbi:class I adenylate-forming enzyme family protein [Oceanibacterium hippocampi]|uniref:Long-chain-fatty-acid--CoA ligase n=1 Tax=Oceanibacterium hippocampi TaxID=745714 RepID=A0A1Y5TT30_9PROT|nr:class I adenylate-forming enzyme family protein [Oceanibacterium hippocampi]SLN71861.1 Long-chain-fatty-acid--CoA ligase [Oceanibacterium hippocampi]
MNAGEDVSRYETERLMRGIEKAALPRNLDALLRGAAGRHGSREVAVFFDDDISLTYRALADDVSRMADALQQLGLRFGGHVGIMLETNAFYPVAWLAVTKLGAVAVPINPNYTAREVAFVVADGDVELIIVDAEYLPVIEEAELPHHFDDGVVVAGGAAGRYRAWADLIALGSHDFEPVRSPSLDDPANIQYTSGTTGLPKGAIIPHGFWVLRGLVWCTQIHYPVTRNLISQPLHYIDGQAQFLLALSGGGTAYIAARQSASRFLDWLESYAIEFCSLPEVVTFQLDEGRKPELSLKVAYAYSHRRERYRLNEKRFGCVLRQGYGMTELGSALYVPVEADHMTGTGTVGIPTACREVIIADPEGREQPPDVVGEILVRGRHMFLGYHNRPDAMAASFTPDGWFRTGDIGRRDRDGWFYFLGRRKDMVRRSSENISALEVEEVLRGVTGVVEAAVLPVPDELRGEEVKAYLRLREKLSVNDVPPQLVLDHCVRNLARFKVPRYLEYISEFPRTPGYKIKKSDLIAAKEDLRIGSFDAVEGRWR